MKIFNKRGHEVSVLKYNVADTVYWVPFGPPLVVAPNSEAYLQAHDRGQCKLRVIIDGHESVTPGWVFREEENLSFGVPKPNPDRPDRDETNDTRSNELEKFLRDNAEKVFFVNDFGQFLP